jgi:hypothetical protein
MVLKMAIAIKKLEIIPDEEDWVNSKSEEIEIPVSEFDKLSKTLGIYGFDWYFVDKNSIKYFNNRLQRRVYIDVNRNDNKFVYSFCFDSYDTTNEEIKAQEEILDKLNDNI